MPAPHHTPTVGAARASTGPSNDSSPVASREHSRGAIGAENDAPGSREEQGDTRVAPTEPKKKKKKNGKKGKTRPSGFEEYIVDGPLTPEQAAAEAELYHPSKSFSDRIETCIQKYRAGRKWDPKRQQLFDNYLSVGGISTGPKMFQGGVDVKKLPEEMDKVQVEQLKATDFVDHQDKKETGDEEDDWDVDFAFVVRGFLSYKVPYVMAYRKPTDLELACQTVRNFLNYVVYHNVAPEYADSLDEAIKLCDKADTELVSCHYISDRLLDPFNTACSTIFDGYYAGIDSKESTWAEGLDQAGYDESTADQIVKCALDKYGTAKQKEKGLLRSVVRRDYMSLEVVEVVSPDWEPSLPKSADKSLPENKYFRGSHALGKLRLKPWIPDEANEVREILPEDQNEVLEIWLEKAIIQYCFVGMHIEARVHRLEDDVNFIDSVTGVMTSFYLHLDNPQLEKSDDDEDFD